MKRGLNVEVLASSPGRARRAVRRGTRYRVAPALLGVVGTVLIHALILQSIVQEAGASTTRLVQRDAGGGGFEPLTASDLTLVFVQSAEPIKPERDHLQRLALEDLGPVRVPIRLADSLALPTAASEAAEREDGDPPSPAKQGPPTETAASRTEMATPDRAAVIVNPLDLRLHCRRAEFNGAHVNRVAAIVGLRVFVMPDGRIGQGTIATSSGDERTDRMTLQCLQAFGTFEPARIEDAAIGSWQRLTWNW